MSSTDPMLQMLDFLGPRLFEIDGQLAFWINVIKRSDPKSVKNLLKMIEGMDGLQKYIFARQILIDGFDKMVPETEDKDSDEETIIDDTYGSLEEMREESDEMSDHNQDFPETLSLSSVKTYKTASEDEEDKILVDNEELFSEIGEQSTRSLVDFEDDLTDVSFNSEEETYRSCEDQSDHIVSLSTITSMGSEKSRQFFRESSEDSDSSFSGFW